jgi:ankyrin repeat protein
MLIEHGAIVDAKCDGEWTPFTAACWRGHVAVAEYLLEQGCDRDHVSSFGNTALHYAAEEGHLEVAQLLLRWGVKLDVRNKYGETPADVATRHGHHAIADAIRAEELRRRDHGFKRDRSTIEGTEEHEAAKRPRAEREAEEAAAALAAAAADESDDDDDDDDDDDEGS